jgi:hypothetical protein
VRALLEGEQILDVRKGGLHEDGRHFAVRSSRCWLYGTAEHQRPELLKPAYRHTVNLSPGSVVGEPIRIEGWADIVGAAQLTEPDDLAKIDSKVIWSSEYIESRLKWKRRDPLWVLALRAYRLVEPVEVAWRDAYSGCTSWVELDGLAEDPATLPSQPALSNVAFEARLNGLVNELPAGLSEPVPDG